MDSSKNIQVEQALKDLFQLRNDVETELRLIKIDPFSGEFVDFPERLAPEIVAIYKQRGIERLFSHQAEALENVLQGRHTVVATPTASGKTLIYNAAALDALTRDPQAKSLYLFPTKALSQDQLAELFDLNKALGDRLGLYTYDGDTPTSMRQAIRKQAQIVITNPYMLHSGILPHHTKWASLFENLKYVVIDELHYYTGVFGSHVANVMRRLKRVCAFYGTRPVFIMSSATIANPADLASRLIEEEVTLVDRNGAPRGAKFLVFFNPPVVNRQLGIRRSYVSVTREIAGILLKHGLQVITFANSRLITEILVKYLKNDFEKTVQRPRHGARLPRRLPAQAAARDRERAARRQDQGRGLDQRPGAGHRHRLARRGGAGLLPGLDLLDLAAHRPRRPAQQPVAGRAGGLLHAHRPVHRQPSRVFYRPVARRWGASTPTT